jgi:hypothetical protein
MGLLLRFIQHRYSLPSCLFLLIFSSYGYFVQGGGANQNSRYDLTRALAVSGTLNIDAYHHNTFDKSVNSGHYYSDKAPGLSLLGVPVYALLDRLGLLGQAPDEAEPEAASLHSITWLTVGVLSAVAGVLLMDSLLQLFGSYPAALAAVVLWALGTNAFGYGTLFVAHQLVAALHVVAFWALLSAPAWPNAGATVQQRRRWCLRLFSVGLVLGWAAISEYPALVTGGFIFAYGVQRLGRTAVLPMVIGGMFPGLLLMAYNQSCFGDPFTLGYSQLQNEYYRDQMAVGLFGLQWPSASVLSELLWGQRRGLLPLSPYLALVLPGLWLMLRERRTRRVSGLVLALAGFLVLMNSSYSVWHGGAAMGPRHLVAMLPFLSLPVTAVLAWFGRLNHRGQRVAAASLAGALGLLSVVNCTVSVAVMPEVPERGSWPAPDGRGQLDLERPLVGFSWPLFLADLVSQKATRGGRIGADYLTKRSSHGRDAYNLGERLGLTGKRSLLPLFGSWLLLGSVMLGAALVRRRAPDTGRAPAASSVTAS